MRPSRTPVASLRPAPHEQIPDRQQRHSERGAGQIQIMSGAVRLAPAHEWKPVKAFGNVREDDDDEAGGTAKLQHMRRARLPAQ